MKRDVKVGELLSETMSLVSDARRDFGLYVLVVGGVTALGILLGLTDAAATGIAFGFQIDAGGEFTALLFDIANGVLGVVATYLLLGRLLAARGNLNGSTGSIWLYLGMIIVSTTAVVIGILFVIVPGLILMCRWSAASGFVIGLGEGVSDALKSSWRATRGHAWAIFLTGLVLLFGIVIIAAVMAAILGMGSLIVAGTVSAFVEAAGSALFAAFGIAVFRLVHNDIREISEVFA